MGNKLPDRWLDYQPMGKQIEGTKFICFKVPLKEVMCRLLEVDQRFTPEMLLQRCPNVKLVVDLTNTTRYYNGNEEFSDLGVTYKKILTPGHVIPPSNFVTEFFSAVDSFLSSSADDDSLIGVHCTHGLNRTSYFICSYMINKMGFEPRDAMKAFEEARGHKIERQNYIDDLLNRGKGSTASVRGAYTEQRRDARKAPRIREHQSRWEDSTDWREDTRRHQQHQHHHPFSRPQSNYHSGNPGWGAGFQQAHNFQTDFGGRAYQNFRQSSNSRTPTGPTIPPAMTYAEHRARQNANSRPTEVTGQADSWQSSARVSNTGRNSRHTWFKS